MIDFNKLDNETIKILKKASLTEEQLKDLLIKNELEKSLGLNENKPIVKKQLCASVPEELYNRFSDFCSARGEFENNPNKVSAAGAISQILAMFLIDPQWQEKFFSSFISTGSVRKNSVAGNKRKGKDL